MKPLPAFLSFIRLSGAVASAGIVSALSASTLMFDFGPTVVTGEDRTNSPYHAVAPSFTDTTWNQVGVASLFEGVLYSDGTPAKGVTIVLGRSSFNNWQTLTFAGPPYQAPLANGSNTGVFANTSVGRDAIVHGSDSSTPSLVGVSIGGLPPGKYDVYIVGYNTNKEAADAAYMGFWALPTVNTSNLDVSSYSPTAPQATSNNSATDSWVPGVNYVKLTVMLAPPKRYLTIFAHGTTDAETRGFLNSIQIVPVPAK